MKYARFTYKKIWHYFATYSIGLSYYILLPTTVQTRFDCLLRGVTSRHSGIESPPRTGREKLVRRFVTEKLLDTVKEYTE